MEQGRRTWLTSFVLLLILLVAFLFASEIVFAKSAGAKTRKNASAGPEELTKLKKTPYIEDGKIIVLRFADFSESGYTFTVTNAKTGGKITGKLPAKAGILKVNLESSGLYQENTGYVLELLSKNGKRKSTTRYYTARALKDIVITHNGDKRLTFSWKVSDKKAYTGFLAMASKKPNPVQPKLHRFAPGGVCKLNSASFSKGKWYLSGIAYRTIGKFKYYGERIVKVSDLSDRPANKVTGLKVKKGNGSATISWKPVKGASYYKVYRKSKKGKYKQIAGNVKGTTYKATGLEPKKKYTFSVRAVMSDGTIDMVGAMSKDGSVKTPMGAPDIKEIKPAYNDKNELSIKWRKVKKADFYKLMYRKTGESSFTLLAKTKKEIYSIKKLDPNTSYDFIAYAVCKEKGKTYQSPNGSNIVTLVPAQFVKENQQYLKASKVRTIGYHKWGCEYTKKKYSDDVKLAYVNYKQYSSKTDYLIWISHYTQQVTIFKGSTGKWKIIRAFTVGTGRAHSRSPRGIFKIFRKETGWYYVNTKELYISHYAGRNSFHTRPLYRGGGVATSAIGRPCSHGCVRCYNEDARFIYKKIPIGTTVVSY